MTWQEHIIASNTHKLRVRYPPIHEPFSTVLLPSWWLLQDNMVISNQRVLFLRRQWVWGLCFASHEEAYYLDDLQVNT